MQSDLFGQVGELFAPTPCDGMRNTNLMSCVEIALKRHKELRPAEPELLLLLTDGIHGLLNLTTDQRELLREANAAQMHITIVQLGDDPWVVSCLMELANAMGKCSINSMCELIFFVWSHR